MSLLENFLQNFRRQMVEAAKRRAKMIANKPWAWAVEEFKFVEDGKSQELDERGWGPVEVVAQGTREGARLTLVPSQSVFWKKEIRSRDKVILRLPPGHPSIQILKHVGYQSLLEFEYLERALDQALPASTSAYLVVKRWRPGSR